MYRPLSVAVLSANKNIGWLKQNKVRIVTATTAVAMLISIVAPVGVVAAESLDQNGNVSSSEMNNALGSVPGVLASSDQVVTKSDGDSAATAHVNGNVVDIPKDAAEGVTFGANAGTKLDIALPNAEEAGAAKKVAPGVVGYDSGNGSANAVQPTEDGGVRMLTVIDNPNAPTTYDYKVTVPGGGKVEVLGDGSAIVSDQEGAPISIVAAPWAKDATGKAVATHFTTDGKTLTQHVMHNVPGVTYPVTADPAWLAVAAGMVAWAAKVCVGAAISQFGLSGLRWIIQRNDWYWRAQLEDAMWSCAWSVAGAGALRFAPGSVKLWMGRQVKNLTWNILKIKI